MKNSLLTQNSVQPCLPFFTAKASFDYTVARRLGSVVFGDSLNADSPVAINTPYNHPLFNHYIN